LTNLNLFTCLLILNVHEGALHYYDLSLKFEFFNVTARFGRAHSLLGLEKMDDAWNELLVKSRLHQDLSQKMQRFLKNWEKSKRSVC